MFQTINHHFIRGNIQETTEHSWKFILLTYLFYALLLTLIVFVIYQFHLLDFIQIQTNHIIQLTLIMSLLIFFLIVWVMIKKVGKMTLPELGLKKHQLKAGIFFYIANYLLLNLVLLFLNLIVTGAPDFYPYWSEYGPIYSIGALIAQIFGNVIVEEVYFRGYLLNQFTIKFYRKSSMKQGAEFRSILKGVLLSSTMFAVLHIPIRVFSGVLGIDLLLSILLLIGTGVLFSLIYVFSNNLFYAMAIHILSNISFTLFVTLFDPSFLCFGLGFILILCSIGFKRFRNRQEPNGEANLKK